MAKIDIDALNRKVLSEAYAEYDSIVNNLENIKNQKISRIKDSLAENMKNEINIELTRAKNLEQKRLSEIIFSNKRNLINQRVEMEIEIFDELYKKLAEFVSSEEYIKYLYEKLENGKKTFENENVKIYANSKDIEKINKIASELNYTYTIETDNNIKIGGFIIEYINRSLLYNDTLDSEYENQKEWFKKSAQLIIN